MEGSRKLLTWLACLLCAAAFVVLLAVVGVDLRGAGVGVTALAALQGGYYLYRGTPESQERQAERRRRHREVSPLWMRDDNGESDHR